MAADPRPPRYRRTALRDLAVVLGLVVVGFLLSAQLDAAEHLHAFLRQNESIEADELTIALLLLALGLGVFALLRLNERKRESLARVATETRYQQLVERVPAVTYVWDAANVQGRDPADFISPQLRTVLGFTPREWTSDPGLWDRLVHDEDHARVVAAWELAMADRVPFRAEYRLRTKEGGYVWVRDEATAIDTPEGHVMQGVMFDITERVQVEHALRDAEARYRTLVESVPTVTYIEELGTGRLRYVSPQIRDVLGWTPDEYLDLRVWRDYLHPDDRDWVIAMDERCDVTLEPFDAEYRQFAKDGREVWIQEHAELIRDDYGVPQFWLGIRADITERKHAEQLLKQAEERYRTLVEHLPAAVYLEQPDDVATPLYMSPQYEQIMGYSAEERMRDREMWVRLLHPDDRDRVLEESRRTNQTGEPFRAEYRMRHRDGHWVWVRDEASLVGGGESGGPRRWQGVFLDITEQREAEDNLRRRDATLGAVGNAAQRFLTEPDWHTAAPAVLAGLGAATDVSRVYIYENLVTSSGALAAVSRREWLAPGITPSIPATPDAPWHYAPGFERWQRALGRGEVLHGPTPTFPESERVELGEEAIRSLAVVPVVVGSQWWGFLGFEDCVREREWTSLELDALRAAADILGTAIGRQRAAHELATAERRFRTLVEQMPAITYIEDVGRRPGSSYVSPRYETMLGYTAEERIADPDLWERLLHPEDRDRAIARSNRSWDTGEPYEDEYRLIAKDGHIVWVRDEAVLIHDDDGTPLHWQGIMYDITDSRRAQQQLREAEERFRTLVETVPAVTYIDTVEESLHTIYVSPQVESMLGYTPEQWLREDDLWTNAVHPDDRDAVLELLRAHNRFGDTYDVEYRLRDSSGAYRWIRDQARVVRDPSGTPVASQGVMFDITEQRQAQEGLQEAEERFRALVETTPAILYIEPADPDAPSIYISPQMEEMLGVPAEEYATDPTCWERLLHPDDRERANREYRDALARKEPWSLEYRIVRPDGCQVWINDRCSILWNEDGSIRLTLGFMFDVTEQKLYEQTLKDSEQREREAADRLRGLDDMKNTFLAAVSHELRSPLTSILGLSLTLERQSKLSDDDREDLLARLATNARKLDRLLKDLLDIDRLSRGIVEPQYRVTDVGALVGRTIESLDSLGGRTVLVQTEPVVIPVDPAKVERIVENLVANAARHTDNAVTIWVRLESSDGGALLSVEDDGPGVPLDMREEVFQPFRQGPSVSKAQPGTGIGLSLVGRFAELHGGRAWVAERAGGGAAFHVFLPGAPPAYGGPQDEAGAVDGGGTVTPIRRPADTGEGGLRS